MKALSLAGKATLATLIITLLVLAGCSSQHGTVDLSQELQLRDSTIAELKAEMQSQQSALSDAQRQAQEAEARAQAAEAQAAQQAPEPLNNQVMEAEMLPPQAKAGECYARVLTPPVYEKVEERILAKEASERVEIIPAQYEWVEEQVLVQEAGTRIIAVPAVYEWTEEKILVKEASTKMVDKPAVYENVSEKILVTPARTYWKRGHGLIEKVDNNTGEIMCLIEEPAVYKTVTKRVLKTPATTEEITIPAEYKTVKKQIIKTPATTRTEIIPAKYETVKVRKVVTPPQEKRIPIPAEYRTVTKRRMVQPSSMEWRRVLCETNMTQANVLEIQKALKAKGFDPGPLDGIYGRETGSAVNAFQVAQNLPKGGLTYETISALGIDLSR